MNSEALSFFSAVLFLNGRTFVIRAQNMQIASASEHMNVLQEIELVFKQIKHDVNQCL